MVQWGGGGVVSASASGFIFTTAVIVIITLATVTSAAQLTIERGVYGWRGLCVHSGLFCTSLLLLN